MAVGLASSRDRETVREPEEREKARTLSFPVTLSPGAELCFATRTPDLVRCPVQLSGFLADGKDELEDREH